MKEKLTPIEYLKQYYGVIDGELFDVVVFDDYPRADCPFHFEENNVYDNQNNINDCVLFDLLTGYYRIKRRPFVPKYDETYYFVEGDEILSTRNTFSSLDIALIKCGWVFRTREEALANKGRVMREMKEVMGE